METEIKPEFNPINAVVESINAKALTDDTPTFEEMLEDRVHRYVAFVKTVESVETLEQLYELRADVQFADHLADEIVLNNRIQTLLYYRDRGLVDIDNMGAETELHVRNHNVRLFANISTDSLLSDYFDENDFTEEQFDQLKNHVLISATATLILGGIDYWIDPEVKGPGEYATIHPLEGTIH